MSDKWAEYKLRHCGCKDASRLNSCQGLQNCDLPAGNAERLAAEAERQRRLERNKQRGEKE